MFDCFALGIRLAAFRARIQAAFKFGIAMFYCSAQHTNQAHQSSCSDGRSRRLSSSSAAGCLTILVVFTLRLCIVMIDRRSALDSNSIADCRFTGLVKKGMKIWKLIGGSWLGFLQTKTMSNINGEK